MANIRTINAHFSNGRKYFENKLGTEFNYTEATGPYEYLLGALAGCYCYTLESIANGSKWESLDIEVLGTKREAIPTTLEKTIIKLIAKGVDDKDEFISYANRAKDECSIFQTISRVSKMDLDIIFED